MRRIHNLLFGAAIAVALGFGVSAASEAAAQDAVIPCGNETTEDGCRLCCDRLGFGYGWDDNFGCGCIT